MVGVLRVVKYGNCVLPEMATHTTIAKYGDKKRMKNVRLFCEGYGYVFLYLIRCFSHLTGKI